MDKWTKKYQNAKTFFFIFYYILQLQRYYDTRFTRSWPKQSNTPGIVEIHVMAITFHKNMFTFFSFLRLTLNLIKPINLIIMFITQL